MFVPKFNVNDVFYNAKIYPISLDFAVYEFSISLAIFVMDLMCLNKVINSDDFVSPRVLNCYKFSINVYYVLE